MRHFEESTKQAYFKILCVSLTMLVTGYIIHRRGNVRIT